jgi:hypothetical protein
MSQLTPQSIHAILSECFPRRNDDFPSSYVEELSELNRFGISTAKQLRELLSKWSAKIMEIDASPMSQQDIALCKEDLGDEFVTKRLESGYWFAYPALLRLALELEFGEEYIKYSEKRDGME